MGASIVRLASALPFGLLLWGLSGPGRVLTYEQRLEAQTAIERVYYSHQIGATLPFEEAVPQETISSLKENSEWIAKRLSSVRK